MKLSFVELGPVPIGGSRHQAVKNIIETAQKLEDWGYSRVWFAEHHDTANFVSRAPEVIIPMVASNTSRIRVGSGSVLLNHYSPFKVAEVFTLLGDMFPGRIDMGIGRATTGPVADYALQRNRKFRQMTDDSDEQLQELIMWLTDGFGNGHPFNGIKTHHDEALPEFWLLGSSPWSAAAAANLGLNYAFAGFINPDQAYYITDTYRKNFQSQSHGLGGAAPHLILSLSIYCAETMADACKLAAPAVLMMQRLRAGKLNEPPETEEGAISILGGMPSPSVLEDATVPPRYLIGTPETIRSQLQTIADTFKVDEIMVQCITHNLQHRLQCLQLLAETLL